jgi:hypothetical protein
MSVLLLPTLPALADPVEVTFTGVNGVSDFGYFVSPYYGTINLNPVTLFCVDFANEVSIGETWEANLTELDSGNLSNTRYGGLANALTLYEEAAWLTMQFAISSTDQYGDIQATIWQLFDPNAPTPSTGYWAQQAALNYTSVATDSFEIVTNVGPVLATGQQQEFLVDPAPVPEPSAVMLLATVIALAGCFMRRRYSVNRERHAVLSHRAANLD